MPGRCLPTYRENVPSAPVSVTQRKNLAGTPYAHHYQTTLAEETSPLPPTTRSGNVSTIFGFMLITKKSIRFCTVWHTAGDRSSSHNRQGLAGLYYYYRRDSTRSAGCSAPHSCCSAHTRSCCSAHSYLSFLRFPPPADTRDQFETPLAQPPPSLSVIFAFLEHVLSSLLMTSASYSVWQALLKHS